MINNFCDKLRYKVCDKKFCHKKNELNQLSQHAT